MHYNLANHVHRHATQRADQVALVGDGQSLSYRELGQRAGQLAAVLSQHIPKREPGAPIPRVAVIASRSVDACVAVLGCAWAGATYVPIGTKTPPQRLEKILGACDFAALICDAQGARLVSTEALAATTAALVVAPRPEYLPCGPSPAGCAVFDLHALPASEPPPLAYFEADDLAYLMFTSGTTGVPKGVMISAGSAGAFLEMIAERLGLHERDRTLEVTELGFDVSVLNMFATWQAGAALHVLPATKVMNAVQVARERGITVWSSTPSLVALLRQIKALSAGALPDVRLGIFIGEPLSKGIIETWRAAAPSCVIEDLYGPTEATVVCTGQRIECAADYLLTPKRDVASIGTPLPGNQAVVMNEAREIVADGEAGELALAGVQLAVGYLGAPELTAQKFPVIGGQRWYLTGDAAFRDHEGNLHHLGRIDHQVKVLGNRVELEEIEAHLRELARADLVAVIPWPTIDAMHHGLVAFLCGARLTSDEQLTTALKARVPSYMLPSQLHWVASMPMNANGKIDRRALTARLQEPHGS